VARAKQTARAEARRRHRVATRVVEPDTMDESLEEDDDSDVEASESRSADTRSADARATARQKPGSRQSFMSSWRTAIQRPDIRGDLRELPRLLIGWPFVVALALSVLGALIWYFYPGYSGAVYAWTYLTVPPAVIPMFIVGFFSRRAAYMLGLLIGAADAVVFLSGSRPLPPALEILGLIAQSAVLGMVYAAGIAAYRRFWLASSPGRRAAPAKAPAKAAANRGRQQQSANRRRY
jgi:hypothetical protein